MDFQNNQLFTFLLFIIAFYLLSQIMNNETSAEQMTEANGMPIMSPSMPESMPTMPQMSTQNSASTQFVSLEPSPNAFVNTTAPLPDMHGGGVSFQPMQPEVGSHVAFAPLESAPMMMSQQTQEAPSYAPLYTQTNYNKPEQGVVPVPSSQYSSNTLEGQFATSNGTGLSFNGSPANGEYSQDYNYYPDPVDGDNLFNRSNTLNMGDLQQTDDTAQPPLYSDFKEKPQLNQNFLQNRFSIGLDTSQVKNGRSSLDLRGYPSGAIPALQSISPFLQPSTPLDLYRKGLGDIT